MAGIYIHIPFCSSRCSYCDFYTITQRSHMADMLDAIKRELVAQRNYLGEEPLNTIYFGGGTPSLYNPKELQSVIDTIKSLWDSSALGEITIEANPDDLSDEYLQQLANTNVNRLSIGIQSFIDRDLRLMNRRHTATQAIDAVRRVRNAGFSNITIDLIYGIPGMRIEEWQTNIEQALALGVEHISAYHLTIEEGTPMGRMESEGKISPIDEESSYRQYMLLHELLTLNGFEHYEISNFAKPGRQAQHNSSYWSGASYLGIGPSAHSYNHTERRWVVSDVEFYIVNAGNDAIYESETLSKTDRYNEFIMLSLRRIEGVDLELLEKLFGAAQRSLFEKIASEMDSVILNKTTCRIPPENFLISDAIIAKFFL